MSKLMSIELPTCSKENFEKYTLAMIPIIKPLAKYTKFNVNFQKEYTQEDADRYKEFFNNYGFELSYEFHEYTNPPGLNSIVKFREDTHQIDPSCPFIFSIDDDITAINDKYTRSILASLYHMIINPIIGGVCIEGFMYGRNKGQEVDELNACTKVHKYWTDGGIIVRSIPKFNGLFPEECRNLLGHNQDWLLVKLRIAEHMTIYRTVAPYYKHYEFRNGNMVNAGFYRHKWNVGTRQTAEKTVESYNKSLPTHEEWYKQQVNLPFNYSKYTIDELIEMIDKVMPNEK